MIAVLSILSISLALDLLQDMLENQLRFSVAMKANVIVS